MTTEPTGSRCPSCGSLRRPNADWCSLCHADLRSEEEKAAARPVREEPEQPHELVDPAAVSGTDRDATDWAAELAALSVTTAPRGRHARPPAPAAEPSLPITRRGMPAPASTTPASPVAESRVDAVLAEAGVDVQALLARLAAEPDPLAPLTGSSPCSSSGRSCTDLDDRRTEPDDPRRPSGHG